MIRKNKKLLMKEARVSFINLPNNYKEFRIRLGLVLAYIREYRGIEQNTLSQQTNINLFEVENGLRDIKCESLYMLGEQLKVHMAILITFACCGDGEWTEEKMKEKVNEWNEQNKTERREKKKLMKNQQTK